MPKQSYTATPEGQQWVREAVKYQGLTQNQIAAQAKLKVRTPVSKLVNGKPVERGAFKRICTCLDLDYHVVAGLTFPSVPSAASRTEPSSAVSQGSVGESEDVRRELRFLQDEVSGLRVDICMLMEQDARLSQRVAPRGEVSDLTVSVQELPNASALKEQEGVLAKGLVEEAGLDPRLLQLTWGPEGPVEEAGLDPRLLQLTWGPGSGSEAQIPLSQGDRVEGQAIKPNFKMEEIASSRLGSVLPPSPVVITQSPILLGSGDTNQRQVSATAASEETLSLNGESTRDAHPRLLKPVDRDPKKDKDKKRGWFNF